MTSATRKKLVAAAVAVATGAMTGSASAGGTGGGGAPPWQQQADTIVGWLTGSAPFIIVAGVFVIGYQLFMARSQGMSGEIVTKAAGGAIMVGAGTVGPQLFAAGLPI